jgi:hypothetical protein
MLVGACLISAAFASSRQRSIDTGNSVSVITTHVYKAGVLSAFGHDHEIAAPIADGRVDIGAREVELSVNTAVRLEVE